MDAIIIDINETGSRTPQQTIRAFCQLNPPEAVETALWDLFKTCALAKKENQQPQPSIAAIASLLDQLIALTKAIHQLHSGENGQCIHCGKSKANESG